MQRVRAWRAPGWSGAGTAALARGELPEGVTCCHTLGLQITPEGYEGREGATGNRFCYCSFSLGISEMPRFSATLPGLLCVHSGNVMLENNKLVSKKINIPSIAKYFCTLFYSVYSTAFLYECQHEL